jgi:hypothetical protein
LGDQSGVSIRRGKREDFSTSPAAPLEMTRAGFTRKVGKIALQKQEKYISVRLQGQNTEKSLREKRLGLVF